MNLDAALTWLDGHVNLETGVGFQSGRQRGAPTLARIRELIELLGSPQLEYPSVHVTGTNGKTSSVRMIAALFEASGRSTGLTTSPHLERVNERIGWNAEPIDDDELARVLTQIAGIEEFLTELPSYFEIMIAAALTYFADVAVDVAVVEVGMGGTWDATNVLDAPVAVVTNVGIDHVEYLGTTREEIAADKAGIVMPGSTLVLGETDPTIVPIFEARNPEHLVLRDRDFSVTSDRLAIGGRVVSFRTPWAQYDDIFIPVHGAHQSANAALALATVEAAIEHPLDIDIVHEGFANVTVPGRLEVMGTQPLVLIDGAHNAAGALALRRALDEAFVAAPRTLVVGLLREKNAVEMLDALGVDEVERLVCTKPSSPRALDPMQVADAAIALGVDADRIDIVPDVPKAVARAYDVTGADGQVVITGSLYVVGAARTALRASAGGRSRPA
ncbi:MAG: bifunctional folylpolyglutamate synthase/dihydrofolate synthase [Acidimicrobiia bacterium]|nr:bifunctional folylpolyglutamate synthase/dihydrofolate synthase [Acidimicrobiia bacterium]